MGSEGFNEDCAMSFIIFFIQCKTFYTLTRKTSKTKYTSSHG